MKKTIRKIERFFSDFWARLTNSRDRKRSPYGPNVDPQRADMNDAATLSKVRTTHPDVTLTPGYRHLLEAGNAVINGQWVIATDNPNIGYGGYYIPSRRDGITICNPANPQDYSNRTQRHERAHDIEWLLGLVRKFGWHYPPWARLFAHWINHPAEMVVDEVLRDAADTALQLPHVMRGDAVTLDLVVAGDEHGLHVACLAGIPESVSIEGYLDDPDMEATA